MELLGQIRIIGDLASGVDIRAQACCRKADGSIELSAMHGGSHSTGGLAGNTSPAGQLEGGADATAAVSTAVPGDGSVEMSGGHREGGTHHQGSHNGTTQDESLHNANSVVLASSKESPVLPQLASSAAAGNGTDGTAAVASAALQDSRKAADIAAGVDNGAGPSTSGRPPQGVGGVSGCGAAGQRDGLHGSNTCSDGDNKADVDAAQDRARRWLKLELDCLQLMSYVVRELQAGTAGSEAAQAGGGGGKSSSRRRSNASVRGSGHKGKGPAFSEDDKAAISALGDDVNTQIMDLRCRLNLQSTVDTVLAQRGGGIRKSRRTRGMMVEHKGLGDFFDVSDDEGAAAADGSGSGGQGDDVGANADEAAAIAAADAADDAEAILRAEAIIRSFQELRKKRNPEVSTAGGEDPKVSCLKCAIM